MTRRHVVAKLVSRASIAFALALLASTLARAGFAQEFPSPDLTVRVMRPLSDEGVRRILSPAVIAGDRPDDGIVLDDRRGVLVEWRRPDGVAMHPCGQAPFRSHSCRASDAITGPGLYRVTVTNAEDGWQARTALRLDGTELSVNVDAFVDSVEIRIDRRPPPELRIREARGEGPTGWFLRNESDQAISVLTIDDRIRAGVEIFHPTMGWIPYFTPIDLTGALGTRALEFGIEIEIRPDVPGVRGASSGAQLRLAFRVEVGVDVQPGVRVTESLLFVHVLAR